MSDITNLLEYPDISRVERTGFHDARYDNTIYCGECGCKLGLDDDMYEDEHYDCICKACLLMLHKKEW